MEYEGATMSMEKTVSGGEESYIFTLSLPSTFDFSEKIMGISICYSGPFPKFCLIETTEGIEGISLTPEQKSIISTVMSHEESYTSKKAEYPGNVPSKDDPVLLSIIAPIDIEEVLAV